MSAPVSSGEEVFPEGTSCIRAGFRSMRPPPGVMAGELPRVLVAAMVTASTCPPLHTIGLRMRVSLSGNRKRRRNDGEIYNHGVFA